MRLCLAAYSCIYTHIFVPPTLTFCFPSVAVFSLPSEELAPLNCFSVTVCSRDAMRTCWSLPVSSAARPASPCSAPSPPAARSGGWRCPAWSPSARLRRNRYRGRETEETRVLSRCQLEANIHLWCRRGLLTFGYLVALSVCLGFDYVALYESLHDLLQAAVGNKKAEILINWATIKKYIHTADSCIPGIWLDC